MRIVLLFFLLGVINVIEAQVIEEKVLDNFSLCEHSSTYISEHPFYTGQYIVLTESNCTSPDFTGIAGTASLIDNNFDTLDHILFPFANTWFSDFGNPTDMSFFLFTSNSNLPSGDSIYVGNISFINGPQHFISLKPSLCNYEESDYFSGPSENILTVNYKQGNCSSYKDAQITSWDYNYNIKWEYRYEGARNDEIKSNKKLNNGNLLALGHSNSKSLKTNLFLLELNNNGLYLNSITVGDTLSHTLSNDLEVDSSGNIYMVWNKVNQLYVSKLDSNMQHEWDLPLNTYGLEDIEIQFSKNDNSLVLISNGLNPFTSGFEQLVHKIDVNGNVVWKRFFDERISDFLIKQDGSLLFYGDDNASNYTQIIHFDSTFAYYPPNVVDSTSNPNSDSSSVEPVGISDLTINNAYRVYPNPFKDFVTIDSENLRIVNYTVYNLMGQLISKADVNSSNQRISFSQYAPGAYLLQVELEDGSIKTDKIIYSK